MEFVVVVCSHKVRFHENSHTGVTFYNKARAVGIATGYGLDDRRA
jgi:hypothetical protein